MFERFSRDARSVVVAAHTEAAALGHDSIGPEHLFLGLLEQTDGAAFAVLSEAGLDVGGVRRAVLARRPGQGLLGPDDAAALLSIGIDLEAVIAQVEGTFGPDALAGRGSKPPRPRFSKAAKKALQLSLREAVWLKSSTIGTEHVLLGILRCDDPVVLGVLADIGTDPADLRASVLRRVGRAA